MLKRSRRSMPRGSRCFNAGGPHAVSGPEAEGASGPMLVDPGWSRHEDIGRCHSSKSHAGMKEVGAYR